MKAIQPTMKKSTALAIAGVFLFGFGVGIQGKDTETIVKTEVKTVTKTKTKKQEVEIKVMPQSCVDLVATVEQMSKATTAQDDVASAMLDLASRLRLAVQDNDGNEANVIETDLRQVQSKLISAVRTQVETEEVFEDEKKRCLEEAP